MTESQEIRVLLIEDNPGDLHLLEEYFAELSNVKFKLQHVQRMVEALDFLGKQSYDVVLLDLGLPDSQGVETFARVHARSPQVPILVLTGLDDEVAGGEALKHGAQDYLVKKDVKPQLLGKAIRYAIERHHATAELERHAAELQASEARVRALIEADADAVFVVDTEARVRFVNPAAERMFFRKPNELLANPFPFPIVTEGATEVEIFGGDGQKRVAEMRVTATEWDGERVQLAWLRDISDRKQMEQTMMRAEKMQALGTLAGGIAHDFNNILLAVSGNAKLALNELQQDHPARVSVLEIAKAGSRATALTRKILSFSRQDETKRLAIHVAPVVAEALSLLRSTLPVRIEIRAQLPKDLPPICADASQIHQIIVNLATNAADAIGDRPGVLELSASPIHMSGEGYGMSSKLAPGPYVRLSVKDTGPGIDKKSMARIFEPFFTTKPQGRGTGMGLAIVEGIMKNHLGEVTVYSEGGKGTVFHLYFPVAQGSPAEVQTPVAAPPGQGQHILYVDDEEPLVMLVTRTLKSLGYEVTGFTDPIAALRIVRERPSDFDAVVTDLSMPTMSGTDLTRELLRIRSDLPVILTTGYIRSQDQELARQAGVRELILKPDTVEELGNALHRQFQKAQNQALAAESGK